MSNMRLFKICATEYKCGNQFDNFVVLAESFDDAWVKFWKYIDTLNDDDIDYIGHKTDYFEYYIDERMVSYHSNSVKSNMVTIDISYTNFDVNSVAYIGGGYEYN